MKPAISVRPILSNSPTEYLLKPYKLSCYTFCFLLEGEVLALADDHHLVIGPGQFVLVAPDKRVMMQSINSCQGFIGSFTLESLKDASYPILRSGTPVQQSFWFDDAVFVGALLRRMTAACEDKDTRFLQSGLDLILTQLRPGGKVSDISERFLQMVFARDHVPQSVTDYAQVLEVTPNYLNKTVKNRTRRTAIDWIEIARINIAKQLLKDPRMSVAEVSARTGLPDQSYFSRFFKKKTGQTPSEFRNAQ